MKDIEDFVKSSVKIEKQSNGEFGYFPFHCFVEKENGGIDMVVLAGVDSVDQCYQLITSYIAGNARRVYIAIDFPARIDIKTDFVAVFECKRAFLNLFAIPYDNKSGEIFDRIKAKESRTLIHIVENLKDVAIKFWMKNEFKHN